MTLKPAPSSTAIADPALLDLSFTGFRLPPRAGARRERAPVYMSLRHWFEAEKFRSCEPDLFSAMLMQPTQREAVKLAKRNQTRWRMDWAKVRCRALACGMVYASLSEPNAPRWATDAKELAAMLTPLGLPEKFQQEAAAEYVRLRDGPKVAFLGAATAPHDAVGKRVNAVHRKTGGAWTLLHWCGRGVSWPVHDWAVAQFVPIIYLGDDRDRMSEAHLVDLARRADTVVVFEERGGKTMDRTLRTLRAQRRCSVELDLFDPPNGNQLVVAT